VVTEKINLNTDNEADVSPTLVSSANNLKRLKIHHGDKIWILPVESIIYFQAHGRYVKVFTAQGEGLVRKALKNLLLQLSPDSFWQVHRSTVINIDHLDYVYNGEPEKMHLHMKILPDAIPVSRSFSHLFK